MPLIFADNVPRWMRTVARRWVRILGYVDWKISLSRQSAEDIPEDEESAAQTLGYTHVLAEYLSADVTISDGMGQEEAEAILCHEFLHNHYESFTLLFDQLWDGRRKLDRQTARTMLAHLIEDRIQRHVQQLQRARERS